MRIKAGDIPALRINISLSQFNKCKLCGIDLNTVVPCLDHDHTNGKIRGVLCGNCNGIEGKIFNLARRAKRGGTETMFLNSILLYWDLYSKEPRDIIHPTHKTSDEKRLRRNKKARDKRKKS